MCQVTVLILTAVLMEDMRGFEPLQELLTKGEVDECVTAVERVMKFLGHVHKSTWLRDMSLDDQKTLTQQYR